jgi:putative ABC transport system substrate-binding protein
MRRREFIGLIAGAAVWPLSTRAQQPVLPVIGFLRSTTLADAVHQIAAFRHGLKEEGFVEGQNVAVIYQAPEDQPGRLRELVAEFVGQPVAVIVGNSISALAAKAATTTVPIVFGTGGDPVQQGLVANLNHPGGNVTGVSFFAGVLGAKRLELLRELVPKGTTIAMLVNPNSRETEAERSDVKAAAHAFGEQVLDLDVSSERDIETAFATFIQRGAGALVVGAGVFFNSNRERLVALAARHALPASYSLREFVADGGLMSYGTSITDAYRQVGIHTGRILKGEKPGEMPVVQSNKLDLIINLKTVRALGLEVPPTLLARADEVIE